MSERTIIATVEVTDVIQNVPEGFTVDKEMYAGILAEEIKKALNVDDVVVTNVQAFEQMGD